MISIRSALSTCYQKILGKRSLQTEKFVVVNRSQPLHVVEYQVIRKITQALRFWV